MVPLLGNELAPADHLEVMGLKLTVDATPSELIAPLMGRARDKFWGLKHVLCRRGNLKKRLMILQSVVAGSALWSCAALPMDEQALGLVNQAQTQFIVWMMQKGRRQGETWLDHHIRTHREARSALHFHGGDRWSTVWLKRVWRYSGHRARAGMSDSPPPSAVVDGWRSLEWWQREQCLSSGARHPASFHAKLMKHEKNMNAGANGEWRQLARDRGVWKSREIHFLRLADVKWASRRQVALSM